MKDLLSAATQASAPRRTPADARTVELLRAGDRATFTELITRLHGSLVRLARGFVRDEAAAEDVVQESWAKVLASLDGFEGRSALKTWIFSIVVNTAKSRAQREERSLPFSALGPPEGDDEVDPARFDATGHWSAPPRRWSGEDPERQLLRAEAMTVLARALDELPPAQRTVVLLRDVEGEEPAAVCHALGVSESNQRVLLHRGRTRLRRALERWENEEAAR